MHEQVKKLQQKKQYEQRTKEWFSARTSLITASSAASLLKRTSAVCNAYVSDYNLGDIFDINKKCANPYSSRNTFILDKCNTNKSFTGNIATYWGQKYESVVTDIYSNKFNVNVLEFGLIIHDTYPYLGASPDGISEEGIMIEIKCPFRRKITGIPPFYYWIQVQLQLEVCDLEFCDFVEYEFTEFSSEQEFLDDDTLDIKIQEKGLFIQYVDFCLSDDDIPILDPSKSKYCYPPKEYIGNAELLLEWKNKEILKIKGKIAVVYWKATDSSIVRIQRNKEWFKNVLPDFSKEYKNILYYQADNNHTKLLNPEKVYIEGTTLDLYTSESCAFTDSE